MTFVSNTKIPRVFIRSAQEVNNYVRKGKREGDFFFLITSTRARTEGNIWNF